MVLDDRSVRSPVLDGLTDEHRAAMLDGATAVTFAKRQRLFAEQDKAVGCWLIRRGQVAIDVRVTGRGPVTIQTLGPGDLAGWSWLLPAHVWQFGAVALTEVDAILLDTDRIVARCVTDPVFGRAVGFAMCGMVVDRLGHTRARLLDVYGIHHVRD
jgi:CRP-like cAMP-binding protein